MTASQWSITPAPPVSSSQPRVELPQYTFPNKMGRIFLLSLEEELGRNGLKAILRLARLARFEERYPPANFEREIAFEEISRLLSAIEELYGPRGGRMISLRAGRDSFKYGLRDFGGLVSFADLVFHLTPLSLRARLNLEILAEIFNRYSDQQVQLSQEGDNYLWQVSHCGLCWERKTTYPACSLMVGLLQESLYWVSGGELFDVEEIACVAMGDEQCVMQIVRQSSELWEEEHA